MNVGAFQEDGPGLATVLGSLPGPWLCDLWFPGSCNLLRRGPWSLSNISIAQVRRRDELAVSPNSPAVTFNEGLKPGYSVLVMEHSRASTHILPTNEAQPSPQSFPSLPFLSHPGEKWCSSCLSARGKEMPLLKWRLRWHSLGLSFWCGCFWGNLNCGHSVVFSPSMWLCMAWRVAASWLIDIRNALNSLRNMKSSQPMRWRL